MTSQTHELKCWPAYFDAASRGEKMFEVRRDDRGYQKGDVIRLLRTEEENIHRVAYNYDGEPEQTLEFEIIYILTGGQFGVEPGYVVLGLKEHP